MSIIKYKKTIILFVGIFFIIFPIAPISSQPLFIEKPDFLMCLLFAWLIIDPKNVSLSILVFLSLFADILWHRPLGLWPFFVLTSSLLIQYMLKNLSIESYFLKIIWFILFLLSINLCIYLTSIVGLTEQLNFHTWFNRLIFSILFFPFIFYLLEILLFKDINKSKIKF